MECWVGWDYPSAPSLQYSNLIANRRIFPMLYNKERLIALMDQVMTSLAWSRRRRRIFTT